MAPETGATKMKREEKRVMRTLKIALVLALAGCWVGQAQARNGYEQEQGRLVIASGGTTSTATDLKDFALVGIQFPAMTSTTATGECSHDRSTWETLKDSGGTQWSITISGSEFLDLTLDGNAPGGCKYFRLVVGSPEGGRRVIPIQKAR